MNLISKIKKKGKPNFLHVKELLEKNLDEIQDLHVVETIKNSNNPNLNCKNATELLVYLKDNYSVIRDESRFVACNSKGWKKINYNIEIKKKESWEKHSYKKINISFYISKNNINL